MSHGKSFSQVRTNFLFDEDLHVDVLPPAESSLALFRPLVVLFDNRNALISMTITRGLWSQFCISRWRTFVFWLALHHGYVLAHAPWSYKISRWQQINAKLKTELTSIILMSNYFSFFYSCQLLMGEWNKRLLEGADQLGKCWKYFKAYVVYRGEN